MYTKNNRRCTPKQLCKQHTPMNRQTYTSVYKHSWIANTSSAHELWTSILSSNIWHQLYVYHINTRDINSVTSTPGTSTLSHQLWTSTCTLSIQHYRDIYLSSITQLLWDINSSAMDINSSAMDINSSAMDINSSLTEYLSSRSSGLLSSTSLQRDFSQYGLRCSGSSLQRSDQDQSETSAESA